MGRVVVLRIGKRNSVLDATATVPKSWCLIGKASSDQSAQAGGVNRAARLAVKTQSRRFMRVLAGGLAAESALPGAPARGRAVNKIGLMDDAAHPPTPRLRDGD